MAKVLPEDEGAASGAYAASLRAFVDAREANGRKCDGLLDAEGKGEVCRRLGALVVERARELGSGEAWPRDEAALCFQVARMIMCERDADMEPLCTREALEAYATAAAADIGGPVGSEALKCLNNALYSHDDNQRSLCESTEAVAALCKVLRESGDHLEGFHRCCMVSMYVVAGDAETTGGINERLCEACLDTLLPLGKSLEGANSAIVLFPAGGAEAEAEAEAAMKSKRAAIDGGLKLVYAVVVSEPDVMRSMLESSKKRIAELASSGEVSLEQLLEGLDIGDKRYHALDRLGLLLVALLRVPPPAGDQVGAGEELDDIKTSAVSILMLGFGEKDFVDFFVERDGHEALVDFLDLRLTRMFEHPDAIGVRDFKDLLPVVIACTNLVTASSHAREYMKARVFPRELPLPDLAGLSDAEIEQKANDRKMEGNTPKDVLGGRLISFMTCLESNLKRYAGELLYVLCGESAQEMTIRCGYGHSAHILAIKGGTIGSIIAQQAEQDRIRDQKQSE